MAIVKTVLAIAMVAGVIGQASTNCVTIGAPKPNLAYHYRYADISSSTDFTNRWEEFTATGSRLSKQAIVFSTKPM